MLTREELKTRLQKSLPRADKLLMTLAVLREPSSVTEIRAEMAAAGFSGAKKWNVSQVLKDTKGKAITVLRRWELTEEGISHLRSIGVLDKSPAAIQLATDLRSILVSLNDEETKSFLDEAISCYELGFYRSAVVMSWLAAIHVLKTEIINSHSAAFNLEACNINNKWKMAKNTDDLGLMKEFHFLEILQKISVIGKNTKEELQKQLKLRNGCGHPNSLKIGANSVASHLEVLLLNVFKVYC